MDRGSAQNLEGKSQEASSDDASVQARDLSGMLSDLKAAREARDAVPTRRSDPAIPRSGGWARRATPQAAIQEPPDLAIPDSPDTRSLERFLADSDRALDPAEFRDAAPPDSAPSEADGFAQPFTVRRGNRAPKPPVSRDHLDRREVVPPEPVVPPQDDILELTHRAPPLRAPQNVRRERLWPGFLLRCCVFSLIMAAIWGPTKYYIENAPKVYESSWRIILPGEGVKSGLRLAELGEARTSTRSMFEQRDFDARATYREIAASDIVRRGAADALDMPAAEFAEPKILAIPQTAILQFRIRRESPEMAQRHAEAYQRSFDNRVETLRRREQGVRQGVAEQNINGLRAELDRKRNARLNIQRDRGLQSEAQFKSLVESTDELSLQLTREILDLRALEDKFNALAGALGISPEFAALALTLKGDRLFQTLSQAYVEAEAELVRLRGNLGERHPDLVTARVRRDEFRRDVAERSYALIGYLPPDIERIMDLTQSAERGTLFADLLDTKATLEGQRARVGALNGAVADARYRLPGLAEDAAMLSAAEQEAQVAEAVYASVLASVDLSTSDPFASYPLYQLLDEPNLPVEPVSPRVKIALAGAAGASFLVILAFAALWYRRKRRRARLRKSASSGPSA